MRCSSACSEAFDTANGRRTPGGSGKEGEAEEEGEDSGTAAVAGTAVASEGVEDDEEEDEEDALSTGSSSTSIGSSSLTAGIEGAGTAAAGVATDSPALERTGVRVTAGLGAGATTSPDLAAAGDSVLGIRTWVHTFSFGGVCVRWKVGVALAAVGSALVSIGAAAAAVLAGVEAPKLCAGTASGFEGNSDDATGLAAATGAKEDTTGEPATGDEARIGVNDASLMLRVSVRRRPPPAAGAAGATGVVGAPNTLAGAVATGCAGAAGLAGVVAAAACPPNADTPSTGAGVVVAVGRAAAFVGAGTSGTYASKSTQ